MKLKIYRLGSSEGNIYTVKEAVDWFTRPGLYEILRGYDYGFQAEPYPNNVENLILIEELKDKLKPNNPI